MYFATGEKTFTSFEECVDYHVALAEAGQAGPLENTFKVDFDKFIQNSRRQYDDHDPVVAERHVNETIDEYERELEFYWDLEDYYNCSGMCQTSLFYFSKDLDDGPPKETCLIHLKGFLSGASRSFAITSVLTGVVALFQFFFHICLYSRPEP